MTKFGGARRRPKPDLRRAMIELILMQRVDKLGQMGELVKVKPG